jgi:hypothetical protein
MRACFAPQLWGGLLLAACASAPDWARVEHHVVMAGSDGVPVQPRDPEKALSDPRGTFDALLELAAAECEATRPGEARRLVIHAHGGLKGFDDFLLAAQRAIAELDADARLEGGGGPAAEHRRAAWKYPIFLIWPSSIWSSSYDHLFFVRRGRWATWSGPWFMPVVLVSDLARGIATAPVNLAHTWVTDTGLAYSVVAKKDPYPSWKNATAIEDAAQRNGYHLSRGEYRRGFWNQTARFASYWLTFVPKTLVQVFLLDGIGRGGWDIMTRRTQNVLFADEEFVRRPEEQVDTHLDTPGRGAFSLFMRSLVEHVERHKGEAEYEITLVAHSMGSMVLNHVLIDFAAGKYGDLPIRNVVYMAPACSTADATEALVPALLRWPKLRFYLLTLHPLAEADEAQWNALDLTPRGSLLEWIDAFYTDPPTHVDRVFGKWVNAVQAIHLFAPVRDRVFFKAFDAAPESDAPTTHGGFNQQRFWDEAFWQPEELPPQETPRAQSKNVKHAP